VLVQDQELLFIGQLAAQSGIPIRTIRYYEGLGLLTPFGRSEGGFRLFAPEALSRLAFIKRCQSLGLSLEEIGEFLKLYSQGQLPCGDIKEKLETKVVQVDQQIEQLLTLRAELQGLLSGWQDFPIPRAGTICPIIQQDQEKSSIPARLRSSSPLRSR
jgi:DNA-binding transcriptional MerR regulator